MSAPALGEKRLRNALEKNYIELDCGPFPSSDGRWFVSLPNGASSFLIYEHGREISLFQSSPLPFFTKMARNLFSVPIFFIVFRETLEAAIIVSVLLGLAEQIVHDDPSQLTTTPATTQATAISDEDKQSGSEASDANPASTDAVQRRRLVRKLRFQVGALF